MHTKMNVSKEKVKFDWLKTNTTETQTLSMTTRATFWWTRWFSADLVEQLRCLSMKIG